MKRIPLILIAMLCLAVVGCATEYGEKPVEDYDALMDAALTSLAEGDSGGAHDRFVRAQVVRPHDPAAGLGVALSDVQALMELVDSALVFVVDFTAPQPQTAAVENPGGLEPGSTLGDTIHHFIKMIAEPPLTEMLAAIDDALADPDIQLDVPAYPLELQGDVLVDLGGEWDRADVLWLAGIARAGMAVVDLLQAINLDFDIGPLLAMDFLRDLVTGETLDIEAGLAEVVETLLLTLEDEDYPDFLLPLPGQEARFAAAQLNLALAAGYGAEVFEAIDRETDGQADDVLGYHDDNGNHRRDAGEVYFLAGGDFPDLLMQLAPSLPTVLWKLHLALAEGTEIDRDPDVYETFDPASLNAFLRALGLPALIPSAQWDLAAFFVDRAMAGVKDVLIDALSCAVDSDDYTEGFSCLFDLF